MGVSAWVGSTASQCPLRASRCLALWRMERGVCVWCVCTGVPTVLGMRTPPEPACLQGGCQVLGWTYSRSPQWEGVTDVPCRKQLVQAVPTGVVTTLQTPPQGTPSPAPEGEEHSTPQPGACTQHPQPSPTDPALPCSQAPAQQPPAPLPSPPPCLPSAIVRGLPLPLSAKLIRRWRGRIM